MKARSFIFIGAELKLTSRFLQLWPYCCMNLLLVVAFSVLSPELELLVPWLFPVVLGSVLFANANTTPAAIAMTAIAPIIRMRLLLFSFANDRDWGGGVSICELSEESLSFCMSSL